MRSGFPRLVLSLAAAAALAAAPRAQAGGDAAPPDWAEVVEQVVFLADSAALAVPPPVFLAEGRASYYGERFRGRRTASGERFDPDRLTAAHRTLPFGTRLRVTNLRNGRSVVVRVTDRGPYHGRRVLDLSKEAARQLGMIRRGVARVRIERLPRPR